MTLCVCVCLQSSEVLRNGGDGSSLRVSMLLCNLLVIEFSQLFKIHLYMALVFVIVFYIVHCITQPLDTIVLVNAYALLSYIIMAVGCNQCDSH